MSKIYVPSQVNLNNLPFSFNPIQDGREGVGGGQKGPPTSLAP